MLIVFQVSVEVTVATKQQIEDAIKSEIEACLPEEIHVDGTMYSTDGWEIEPLAMKLAR